MLTVTPGRIRIARWLLLAVATNLLVTLCAVLLPRWWRGFDPETAGRDVVLFAGSLFGASLVYIALHWGFRPQNLFGGTRMERVLGRGWRERLRERELNAERERQRRSEAPRETRRQKGRKKEGETPSAPD